MARVAAAERFEATEKISNALTSAEWLPAA